MKVNSNEIIIVHVKYYKRKNNAKMKIEKRVICLFLHKSQVIIVKIKVVVKIWKMLQKRNKYTILQV